MEIWKAVPGFEGQYEASTHGKVRSLDRVVTTKRGVKKHVRGSILSALPNTAGYLSLRLGRGNPVMVHQVVAHTFIGVQEPGVYVCHQDGNKFNNHLENLRYDTPASNQRDRERHGTTTVGEQLPQTKLTAEQAAWVRDNYGTESNQAIGERFGVSRATIFLIGKGRNWKHLGTRLLT